MGRIVSGTRIGHMIIKTIALSNLLSLRYQISVEHVAVGISLASTDDFRNLYQLELRLVG